MKLLGLSCCRIFVKEVNLSDVSNFSFVNQTSEVQGILNYVHKYSLLYIMYCNLVRKNVCIRFVTLHELSSRHNLFLSLKGYFLTTVTFFFRIIAFLLKTIKCLMESSALQTNIATKRCSHSINRILSF